ncbi:MAG: DNA repair protein RecO [Bacteroidales bacterium]|nr:DNA repair protein RecO [Bacteroidales bacterium]
MLEKTKGIVLQQIKYTDSGIVVHLFTRSFGRRSFILKGVRNKKCGKHNVFFQPLFLLDLVFYNKESRSMPVIKEFSVSYAPGDIYSNARKSCMALFMSEVMSAVLKEESPNENLFDFLANAIIYFDESGNSFVNFHISFLSGLSSYLGFQPALKRSARDVFFDMINGTFTSVPPLHGNYAGEEVSAILSAFFSSSYDKASDISLNGRMRNEVLETIIRYYSLHLPGLKRINSLRVLKEVFS